MAGHRCTRAVGWAGIAGAVWVFGVAPVSAPAAQAEIFDDIVDQVLAPFVDTATGNLDWAALLSPAAWDSFAAASASATSDVTGWFEQAVYAPLHAGLQDWIDSEPGREVDAFINTAFGSYVIGNGTPGSEDHPAGGAAGWLFGDGGAGWTSDQAGTPGGVGGAAGWFGNGGAGGAGGAGAAGGAGGGGGWLLGVGGTGGAGGDAPGASAGVGGAGGDGGWLFGVGGAGGDGGDGADGGYGGDGGSATGVLGSGGDGGDAGNGGVGGAPTGPHPLPALGGAGGNGSALGAHGAVGHFGTIAGVAPTSSSAIGVTGTWLTDPDGRVVMLHGLNQVYKIPPYEPSADGFGNDDAAFLAANGFNAVRVGIIWAGVEPEPGVIDYAYLDSIKQTVQTLADHGIVSILDMHQDLYSSPFTGEGAPEWAVQDGGLPNPDFGFPANYFLNPAENHAWDAFWSNAEAPDGVGLENHYARMWEAVANYFKDVPDVAGYEIMNEPWAGAQWLNSLFGNAFFGTQQLTPFYNQVDSAIRAVDPATPVLFEPNTLFGSLPVPTHLGTVDDPNSVFSFHNYCIVSTLIPSTSFTCDLNADIVMSNAEAYAGAHGIPALMTEFGATDNTATIAAGMHAADQHRFGWLEWAYTGNDITSSSPNGQALVLDPSKPPVGDNVNTDKLATLAEPYPQAIGGTPDSWSFHDGTFQLSYSTERVDGLGSFPAGTQTTISVPAIEYPHGYQVSVTGGHVVSAVNAPTLVIESAAGAGTVNVTVSPAAG